MQRSIVALSFWMVLQPFACGGSSDESSSEDGVADGAADGAPGGAAAVDASAYANLPTAPIPEGGLSCPPHDDPSQEEGSCCYKVFCYSPPGGAACNPTNLLTFEQVYPYFHGACTCGIKGPFSKQGVEDIAETPGECCYIAGSNICV